MRWFTVYTPLHVSSEVCTFTYPLTTACQRCGANILDSKRSFRRFRMVCCVVETYPLSYCHHVLHSSRWSGITSFVWISRGVDSNWKFRMENRNHPRWRPWKLSILIILLCFRDPPISLSLRHPLSGPKFPKKSVENLVRDPSSTKTHNHGYNCVVLRRPTISWLSLHLKETSETQTGMTNTFLTGLSPRDLWSNTVDGRDVELGIDRKAGAKSSESKLRTTVRCLIIVQTVTWQRPLVLGLQKMFIMNR